MRRERPGIERQVERSKALADDAVQFEQRRRRSTLAPSETELGGCFKQGSASECRTALQGPRSADKLSSVLRRRVSPNLLRHESPSQYGLKPNALSEERALMDPRIEQRLLQARRQFLGQSGVSVGMAALASLVGSDVRSETGLTGVDSSDAVSAGQRGLAGLPHFAPQAKRVIYLMQSGAPSHVDLFDYKPGLDKRRGEELPESVTKGQRLTTMTAGQKSKPFLPSISGFKQFGECGGVAGAGPMGSPGDAELDDVGLKTSLQFSDTKLTNDRGFAQSGSNPGHPAAKLLDRERIRRRKVIP